MTRETPVSILLGLALTLGSGCAPSAPPPGAAVPLPPSPSSGGATAGDRLADAGPPHWSYSGEEGPSHWGDLSPDFALCKTGSQQTPIDLPASAGSDHAAPLTFGYHAFPLSLLNNGHTVQVLAASGSSVIAGPTPADRYALVQFHVHTPSEHTLAGKSFPLELHLVHKNASGSLLVVGLLFNAGKENPVLSKILALAPAAAGAHVDDPATVDPSALLPATSGYFHYTGSLTTPPCSEGVAWYVMSTVGEVSEAQIARYQGLLPGATNRPIQPLGGRSVVAYRP